MYENMRKLQDVDVKNKTVVVRVNYDVPLDSDGQVLDSTRIESSVKTIEHLLENNCKVVLISHLGRPEGEDDDLSLMPARFELGKFLNKSVKFAHISACANSIKFMEEGEVLLLENLRFCQAETSENIQDRENFIKILADLCDIYVNDSFGVYREHASVYDLPKMMPSYSGFALQKEIEALSKIKEDPQKPFLAVIGGKKMDTKIPVIKSLIKELDVMLLGGAMAYTFLAAQGVQVGNSLVEVDMIPVAKEILEEAKANGCEIKLPVDHICGAEFDEETEPVEIDTQHIPDGLMGLDIGQRTMDDYRNAIESAKTILWNGPLGVFEWENFNKGTEAIGEYIALSTSKEAFKVTGGSETTYALSLLRIKPKRFNHVSIGGGMMLKYLSGDTFDVLNILCGEQNL